MNLRLAAIAPWCREAALPVLVLACIAASGFAPSTSIGAPTVNRLAQSLAADAKITDVKVADAGLADTKPADAKLADTTVAESVQPTVLSTAAAEIASTPAPEATTVAAAPAANEPDPIVTAALTDSSEMLPPETPPAQAAQAGVATGAPSDTNRAATPSVIPDSIEIVDECFIVDICVDRYLWTLYQRAPKEDSVRTEHQRQVTVRKKRKLVTVTRTFTTVTDEDFSWKDPKAAEKAGMPLPNYVIGGVDRDFKLRLFYMLHAAEEAGLSPGITSAFRDDYRQSIASGLKAANDRSFHGGSFRGGYGHGLAADIVSIKGATRAERLASTQMLWKWIDARGKDFGIGRPYLDRDPPHVAPIDGEEYAHHHPGMKAWQVASAEKPRNKLASRYHRSARKHARAAKSSKLSAL
ncbi:MAG TPA: peptidase M15 [Bradyrhizobium sp.]